MGGSVAVYGKKIFSIALIFNSLMSIVCTIELLYGFYQAAPYWQPFAPYLADGNLLWLVIMAAAVNIYPAASIGRALKTGRLLFHHYVYGFLVLALAIFAVFAFTPISPLSLFTKETSDVAINAGRFFILGGLALLLDDLPDTSKRVESTLNWLKSKVYRRRRIVHYLQLFLSAVLLYIFFAISLWAAQNPQWLNVGNAILIGTILITSLTSITLTKRKTWQNMVITN